MVISGLITIIGLVDFLSFISSAGYMFVLFWASLAMVNLRKKYPDIERPFKTPLFPLTAILAAGSGLLIITFANPTALIFLGGVIVILAIVYFVSQYFKKRMIIESQLEEAIGGGRILVAAINPKTAEGLVDLASRLAEHQEDTSISLLSVVKVPSMPSQKEINEIVQKSKSDRITLLERTAPIAQKRNVAISTKTKVSNNVESAIYKELKSPNPVKLIMLGWPSLETKLRIPHNIIKEVMVNARGDVVVFRNRGINGLKKILMPFTGGPNSRLLLNLAQSLAYSPDVHVTALHLAPLDLDEEGKEDASLYVQEIIEEMLGEIPPWMDIKVVQTAFMSNGILDEARAGNYDLLMIGAGSEAFSHKYLFGSLNDTLIEEVDCSMIIVRRYQAEASLWLRNRMRVLEK
jgi:nucleotide-binding universal stress UspA family protein